MNITSVEEFSTIEMLGLAPDDEHLLVYGEASKDGRFYQTELPLTPELLLVIVARNDIDNALQATPDLKLAIRMVQHMKEALETK